MSPRSPILLAGYPDENVCVPWDPHTAHELLTPGHRSGDPWPPGRENPHPTRPVTGNICLCLCAFSFPEHYRLLSKKILSPVARQAPTKSKNGCLFDGEGPHRRPFFRNCLKYVRSNSVPSRLLPNSCLLNLRSRPFCC